jgi:DNA-binding beta-propeller fold protein YncE
MPTILRLALLVSLVAPSAAPAATLYATDELGTLYRLDSGTGDLLEDAPGVGSIFGTYAVAYQPVQDRLYVMYEETFTGLAINSYDPDDDTSIRFATDRSQYSPSVLIELAWNPAAGNFLFVDQARFGTMTTDGSFSVIAPRGWTAITNADGRWLAGSDSGQLSEIDPTTGLAVGSLDLSEISGMWDVQNVRSLATDPDTGEVYGLVFLRALDGNTFDGWTIVRIDLDTGISDPVVAVGISSLFSGIAFVPEPSTALLLGLGLLFLRRRA